MGRLAAVFGALATAISAARGRLFPFLPVAMGIGIGLWFSRPADPSGHELLAVLFAGLCAGAIWLRGPEFAQPLGAALLAAALGFVAAGVRSEVVRAPVLAYRYYGPVQGRVIEIDRSRSDRLRLTLDRVVLADLSPDNTPARVRVSLNGTEDPPLPGTVVLLTATLLPPSGPAEPGAFDFRRAAWFERLGGVGTTSTPLVTWAGPGGGDLWIERVRSTLSGAITSAIPGDAGAFAAGVMTGDRAGLSQDAVQDLRDSNLAHLLAISGMNLAFLTGFTFALIRTGLALVPRIALRVEARKIAAGTAFFVALFYLLLSGANVATERAFIMAAVMLGAVLLDRRAFTLRSVALAALAILAWQPESLTEPGFQMSFAATLALIAGFRAVQARMERAALPGWAGWAYALVLSSVIGGVSTAPFAAATFNRFADYGLIANLLTVPVMGAGVMGAGVVALILWPLGLAALPLAVMGWCSGWILAVAARVAEMEGAVTVIRAPAGWVIPLLSLGALWLALWPGRLRSAGLVAILAALAGWGSAARPVLLISDDGRLAGLVGPGGRALSAAKGAKFAAETWLARDGDSATMPEAAARPGFDGAADARHFRLGEMEGVVLGGKGSGERVPAACVGARIVILPEKAQQPPPGCLVIDRPYLARSGALAVDLTAGGGLRITPSRGFGRAWDPGGG